MRFQEDTFPVFYQNIVYRLASRSPHGKKQLMYILMYLVLDAVFPANDPLEAMCIRKMDWSVLLFFITFGVQTAANIFRICYC